MDLLTLLLVVVVIVVLFGGGYGYHSGWYAGSPYGPSLIGVVIVIVVILLALRLLGRF